MHNIYVTEYKLLIPILKVAQFGLALLPNLLQTSFRGIFISLHRKQHEPGTGPLIAIRGNARNCAGSLYLVPTAVLGLVGIQLTQLRMQM